MKQERLLKLGLKTQAGETTGAYILSFNKLRVLDIPDNRGAGARTLRVGCIAPRVGRLRRVYWSLQDALKRREQMSEGLLVCVDFLAATEFEAATELLRPVVCGGEKTA